MCSTPTRRALDFDRRADGQDGGGGEADSKQMVITFAVCAIGVVVVTLLLFAFFCGEVQRLRWQRHA